ncbi:MAG: translation initiation factor IF-2, partial [Clostridia bacterium]|nr:translation initiation factor IF-2 [Clostridia bacterium]
MSFVKYRLKEVATDFGVTPKEISEIISKYYEKPKSNTQVLNDNELNAVFDYMAQKNQIKNLDQVFAVKAPAPKAEAPKTEEKRQDARPQNQGQNRPQQNPNRPQQGQPRPQQQNNQPRPQQAPAPKNDAPKEPERKRERRVVDTSAVQVNSNRFADVDNLVSERVQNYQGGKQRIGGGKGKQQQKQQKGNFKGNKSRNEEQEKMRRLQMEVARKAPLTVKIPDEITVGE